MNFEHEYKIVFKQEKHSKKNHQIENALTSNIVP